MIVECLLQLQNLNWLFGCIMITKNETAVFLKVLFLKKLLRLPYLCLRAKPDYSQNLMGTTYILLAKHFYPKTILL